MLVEKTAIVCSIKDKNCHGAPVKPRRSLHGDSLTPSVALLVCPSGTMLSVSNLQGQKHAAFESRPSYL